MTAQRVLITGGAGFIGSRLAARLISDGHTVGVVVRNGTDLRRIQTIRKNVTMLEADLSVSAETEQAVQTFAPEAIVHLATYYVSDHEKKDVAPMIACNVAGTMNLLDSARTSNVKLFVNASSCAVYAPSEGATSEQSPIAPLNLYAVTKLQAEQACSLYVQRFGLSCITLRIFAPYGPGDHERRLIPTLIRNLQQGRPTALTSGRQAWDFVYVDDVVAAFAAAIERGPKSGHEIVNIGSGRAVTVKDVGEKLRTLTQSQAELQWDSLAHRPTEIWHLQADVAHAKKVLGWVPKVQALERGLADTVEWFKEANPIEKAGVT